MFSRNFINLPKLICTLSLLAFLYGVALPVQARDFYLSASEGSDMADGASAKSLDATHGPFRTFNHACSSLLPGDTLIVASGDYIEAGSVNVSRHEAADAPITVKAADPDHRPNLIFPKGQNSEAPSSFVSFCLQTSHVEIDGINVDGGQDGFYIAPGLSQITIRNCRVTGSYQAGIIILGQSAHLITGVNLVNCEVSGCGRINLDRSGKRDWPHAILGLYAEEVAITGCTVHDNLGEGLGPYTGCRKWDIAGNTVYDNWSVNIYIDTNQGDITVERNFVYCTYKNDPTVQRNRPDGIRIANESRRGTDPTPAVDQVRVLNNIVCGGNGGICCYTYGSMYVEQGLSDAVIANNTIISQAAHPNQHAILLGYDQAPNVNVRVVNNVAYSSTGTGATFDFNGPGLAASHNYNAGSPGFVRANVSWTPEAPPVATDYQLIKDSPCVQAGTATDAPAVDFAQHPRATPSDIGAYAFQ